MPIRVCPPFYHTVVRSAVKCGLLTALLSYACCAAISATAAPSPRSDERPQLALQLGHSLPIVALQYSPDGTLLASGSNDNTVKIWDARSRELIRTLEGHLAPVRGVAFSPDGKVLATGDEDGNLKFWNPQTGVLLRQWPRLTLGVRGLSYSPDGKYFAAACGIRGTGPGRDERGQFVVWDARTWKVLRKPIFEKALISVAFARDGHTLAFGSQDRSVTIAETATGAVRAKMQDERGFPNSIAFSPDGNTLAATDNNIVRLWDAASGAPQRQLADAGMTTVFSLAFSRDGNILATASLDRAEASRFHSRLWDAASGALRETLPEKTVAYAIAFSPAGKVLATGAAGEVRLRALPDATEEQSAAFAARRRWIRSLAWSHDGKTIANASGNGEVLLWDAESGALRHTLQGHKANAQILAIGFSPDGSTLATGAGDSDGAEIILWNARSGSLLRKLRAPTPSLNALAFSPDGKVLATGADAKYQKGVRQHEEIDLWNARSGALTRTWSGRPGDVASLAFSPDGKTLASAQSGAPWRVGAPGDNAVTLREVATGRVLRTLRGHADNISGVAFSPDGKLIASASKDKSVRLWNAQSGKLLKVLNGHTDWVRSVAFSPNGSTLLSAGRDNTLREWSVATGKVLRVLRGHEGDVMDAKFSPDGKRIASGSLDTTLRIWNASDGRELATLLTAPTEGEESETRNPEPGTLWLAATPEGYYNCAEGADYLIKWRFGGKLLPFYHFEETYRRPDFLKKALRGERIAARPLLLTRVPPAIRILALAHTGDPSRNTLRVLIEAADDSELHNSNFQFYVNGVLIPDETARPITVDGKPIVVDGKPITVDGKPITVDGKPITVDGKPIVVDGKPITVDGKPITADGRSITRLQEISTQSGESVRASGGEDMAQYAFHRLYVMDVPLPREEKIVLRAVVSDNEANKSDDGLVLHHFDVEPVKSDLWLVSAGVSHYRNPLYDIGYAAADAQSIAHVLEAQQGGLYAHVHETVLSDRRATAQNIRAALKTLKQAKPDDTVMVFLSGHGVQASGKTYFAPWGVFVNDLDGTCLEWREIVGSISGLYAKKLLFTDACHSGAKLGAHQATSAQLAEAVRRESGIVMLASSQSDEFSYEDKEVKQGIFSLALAEALEGKADVDGDGNVTLPEIAMYVPKRVSESTKGLQNPQLVLVQDFNPQTVLTKVAPATVKPQTIAAGTSTP
jgi:WD40 repeat protein